MSQRRTPGGQGPTGRSGPGARGAAPPGSAARAGSARGGGARGGAARSTGRASREPGVPGEQRRAATRSGEPARSASRPAAARRGGPGGAAKRTTAPRPRRLTGRATVLLVILTALALGYTYPVRVYLDQESDIARMRVAQAEQRARIEGLREEVTKWQDDEYVISQARSRFYFVRPGETPLIPISETDDTPVDAAPAAARPEESAEPWYDTLWSSIRAADSAKP